LRIDELCDANGNGTIDEGETTWRKVEVSTHKPGSIGTLVAKRVYSYPSAGNRCVSNGNTNYAYTYDAVGNVFCVLNSSGGEVYRFSQDAFGNSISIGDFTGSDWTTARNAGITEHQTGKWIDPLTGMYYFSSRWYDPVVGRFVSRDPVQQIGGMVYSLPGNNPMYWTDATGLCLSCGGAMSPITPQPPTPQPTPLPPTPPDPTPNPEPLPIPTPYPTPIFETVVGDAILRCVYMGEGVKGACTSKASNNCGCLRNMLGNLGCEFELCCGFTVMQLTPFWYHCQCRFRCPGYGKTEWEYVDKYPLPGPIDLPIPYNYCRPAEEE